MKRRFLTLTITAAMAMMLMAGCGKTADATTAAATEAATEAASETTEATEAASETTKADTTEAETTEAASEEATEAAKEKGAVKTTKDRSGNDIAIPENVNKIISMAPSTTRFLIDLGLADKIVAVDTNSYAYIEMLPVGVQQFDMMAPDNEALIALQPDIIFTSGMSSFGGEDVFQPARDAGICVADIPSSVSMNDIAEDLKFIGDAVGESEKADEIINEFKAREKEVQAIGETIEDKKTVLFMISLPSADYPSVYTFGKGTYLDEMITDIGAVNVTGDQEGWVAISEEEAVALNPDVIITNVDYIEDAVGVIKSSEGWENVNAIQNDAVYYIDATASNQPNNHVIDALIEMAVKVYPDEFADFK